MVDIENVEQITLGEARELLRRVVQTHGEDYVYLDAGARANGCLYVTKEYALNEWLTNWREGSEPGVSGKCCIVGAACDLRGDTWHKAEEFWDKDIKSIRRYYPDLLSLEAAEYLWAAQQQQDIGATWGEALAAAERSLSDED